MKAASGVAPEVLPLPTGGGAVRSIGETFSPDLHSGTGSYQVPLWFPRGPGNFQPKVSLVYSSGAGNGPYGMGWHLPVMRIARQTDRGTPTYDDALDTFLLEGQEIVPLGAEQFRLRIEGEFKRITRSGGGWEVTDRSGRRFVLGTTSAARIEETANGITRTFAWLIERVIDRHGNQVAYGYRRDQGQLFLESIVYGPYRIELVHEARADAFTNRRAGFAITTALRCTRIEYRLPADPAPLFRSYALVYDECPLSRLSLLASITFSGHRGAETTSLPAVRFQYTPFQPSHRFQPFGSEVDQPPPQSLEDPDMDLVDMRSEGLPGVIEVDGPIRRYWPNKGGVWGAPRELRQLPSSLKLSDQAVAFADMDGDGGADVVVLSESPLGFLRNEPGEGWTSRVRFRQAPSFDPSDPDLRLVDLNGDGRVDALRSTANAFYIYLNRGEQGWDPPFAVARQHDPSQFPDVSLSDPRTQFADMTGDGAVDIVWVHGGRIDYWPALGPGRWGARVSLPLQPAIGFGFDPSRLFLADINGDGLADVVYLEHDRVRFWINRGGSSLVKAGEILHTPRAGGSSARVADMLGTGTGGLLWSFPFSRRDPRNYKYLGFTGGVRPYLMNRIDNGIGMVTEIEYQASTEQALAAARRGQAWATHTPFPVQTVSRITQRDELSGAVLTRRARYYDGFFDGQDREFRGFGRAEVLEEGDAEAPGTLTLSYFHQGHRGVTPGGTSELRGALKGRLYRLEVFEVDGEGNPTLPLRREEDLYEVRELAVGANGRRVLFPHLSESTVFVHERQAVPLHDHTRLVYDDHGNVTEKHERWDNGSEQQELISRFRYTVDTTRWILNLPVELVRTDGAGTLLRLRRYFYDGVPFTGLPLGSVETGKLTRREDMVLTDALAAAVYGAGAPDFAALGLHRITAPGGQEGWAADVERHDYDARGNVIASMDALGNTGQVTFDADGVFPLQVRDPLGHVFDSVYDRRAQQIARITEPNGHETRYRFDALNRVVATVKAGDSELFPTLEFEYLQTSLPFGVRTRLRKQAGQPETLDSVEYSDGFGNRIQLRSSAEGGQVLVDGTRQYNRRGWEAVHTAPFLSNGFAYIPGEGLASPQQYAFRYDALGRVVETLTPDGRTSRIVHDLGTITRFDVSDTDASPQNVARGHFNTPRLEEYDARGRLRTVTETNTGGATLTTRYTFDPLGQLVTITDARGIEAARYTWDLLGRKIEVDHVDAGRRRVAYDARGDLALRLDAEGHRIVIRYDALRRATEVIADGVSSERYTYDAGAGNNLTGRLAKVEDEAGEVTYSYTPRGLVAEKSRQIDTLGGPSTFVVGYAYDSMERMTGVTYPDGAAVTYLYDDRSSLAAIPGFVDSLSWSPQGQLAEVRLANGVVERYTFDPATFYLSELRIDGPTRPEPYFDVTYSYDAVGNPLELADQVTAAGHRRYSRTCTYDALYRLTGMQGELDGAPLARNYQYDATGNFVRNGEFGSGDLFLEPGGSNRVSGVTSGGASTTHFTYDANGNLTASPGRDLDYDARGRLSRVTGSDGTVTEIVYGYEGERVRKRVTSGGVTTETLYVENLFEVRNGTGTRFVYHKNRRIAAVSGGTTRFFHPDHLGNVVLTTDAGGAILGEAGYLPFGGMIFSSGGAGSPHGFIGKELDETGLVFCESRYYDPLLGRFISPDTFLLLNPEKALGLPGSLNLYVYAANNPMRLVDDNGAWWKWLVGALIIAALVVATIVVGVVTGGAGFAFGILLAASIGSAFGAGVGVYSAHQAGGSLEDGFLLGALIGGAAGAGGYALGAAVGAAGISGAWGSILAGATEGAVIGAANGAIIGYAGGKGSLEDVLMQAGIGFLTGAVLGGVAGWVKYNPSGIKNAVSEFAATGSATGVDPATGAPLFQTYTTAPGVQAAGQAAGGLLQTIASATAYPVLYASIGSAHQVVLTYHWDDIKSWILETFGGEDKTVTAPVYSADG